MSHEMIACRSCGEADLHMILSLGLTPLANRLLTEDQLEQPEPRYPLDLAFCPHCSLVQITETVPPEELFGEYLYFSSFSDTMLQHAREIAAGLMQKRPLNSNSLVVEIASNDGYLLQNFVSVGIPVLGIEPARNIAKVAEERGVRTISRFFGIDLADELAADGNMADVILANNVMAHIPEINGVIAGIKRLLKPDGVFIMETPYIKDMVNKLEFDTIYHEHIFYYSLTALENLFRRHGLASVAVERIPIHGGSLRITATHEEHAKDNAAVASLLEEEAGWGAGQPQFYQEFSGRVESLQRRLKELLRELKVEGKRIAAYGASAKGSTLLNFCAVGRETLDFVADRSTIKQGRYTPGTHLPIYPPEKLLESMPDYVLLLTWNFRDEILAQQKEYRDRGGRFIVPVPDLEVV